MQNVNWSRSLIAEELEDTLKFGGLSSNWGKIRTKEIDAKGKSYYLLPFVQGSVKIYGPKFILINRDVCRSATEAKRMLQDYVR